MIKRKCNGHPETAIVAVMDKRRSSPSPQLLSARGTPLPASGQPGFRLFGFGPLSQCRYATYLRWRLEALLPILSATANVNM
jgi:hypothetical protein